MRLIKTDSKRMLRAELTPGEWARLQELFKIERGKMKISVKRIEELTRFHRQIRGLRPQLQSLGKALEQMSDYIIKLEQGGFDL